MNVLVVRTAVVILPSAPIQWAVLSVLVYLVTKEMAKSVEVCIYYVYLFHKY